MTFFTVWLRGGGREKSGGGHKFSLLPFKNWSEKWEKYLDKTAPPLINVSGFFIFYFFKKTLLSDFLCYFLKCPLLSIQNFFKKYNVLLFVLFKRDMMINLYKLYFQPN